MMYMFSFLLLFISVCMATESSAGIPHKEVSSLYSFFMHVSTHRALHRVQPEDVLVWIDWDRTLVDAKGELIDKSADRLIQRYRKKGYKIIINTSRGHNLSDTQDLEEQRRSILTHHREMSQHRIDLSNTFNLKRTLLRFAESDQGHFMPTYLAGYLFAGVAKFKVLHQLLDYVGYKPKLIFGLDDVSEYLDQFPSNKKPLGDKPGYKMFLLSRKR